MWNSKALAIRLQKEKLNFLMNHGMGSKNNLFSYIQRWLDDDNDEWITIRQAGNNIDSLPHR